MTEYVVKDGGTNRSSRRVQEKIQDIRRENILANEGE